MNERRTQPIDRGVLAIDRLTIGYFGITGLFALAVGGRTGALIAGAHLVISLLILGLSRWTPETGFLGFLRVAYPVLAMPAMYAELATLNRFLTSGYYDQMVIGWDEAIFGGQPSMVLSEVLPWVPFSEVVHLGYMSYYLILPAALLGAYLASGREGIHRTAFTMMAAFYTCYMFFILFPVSGPRYEFEPIGGAIAEGWFYQTVHEILEGGSSRGTAFPSSHVAATLGAMIGVAREDMRWFWAMVAPGALLMFGTVYGRFHYGIDAIAGFAVGLAVSLAVPRVFEALRGRQPEPSPGHPSG
ncbi:MAG: phosphatase PAP2 family protein [Gemmatimonadota bacterium]